MSRSPLARLARLINYLSVRLQLRRRPSVGKIPVIFYLSVPLHLNFVRNLMSRLCQCEQLVVLVYCRFPPEQISLPDGVIIVKAATVVRDTPGALLVTNDEGEPLPHHATTRVIHIPHSFASMHVVYPDGAFDHFDYIFCPGPEHLRELSQILPRRNVTRCLLVPAGYEVVDVLLDQPPARGEPPLIAFAPSWAPQNALTQHGVAIVGALIDRYRVTVRPHIQSLRNDRVTLAALQASYGTHPHFSLDTNPDSRPTLLAAALLISDWSGVALEYALSRLRPVIFMDTPMKVFNPHWSRYLDRPGIECTARESVGVILRDVAALPLTVAGLLADSAAWQSKIQTTRENLLFHAGHCGETSARAIEWIARGDRAPEWIQL